MRSRSNENISADYMNFSKHPLLYTLLPLCVLAIGLSFFRFMVSGNYMVSYEGECDPTTHSCFTGCEDEECTAVYYYSQVEKSASDVLTQCGPDITGCSEASVCFPTDIDCSVTYCSAETVSEGEACAQHSTITAEEEPSNDAESDGNQSIE